MRQGQHGFTLLEVLLALSFLGLLMVLIGSALGTGNRLLLLSEKQTDRLTQVRTAQDFLRSALQQALAQDFGHAPDQDQVFEGERQRMRFVAPVPGQLAGGVQVHTLEPVAGATASRRLQISFSENRVDGLHPWGNPQVLMQEIRDLRLSYRGLDPDRQPTGWLEQWPWPDRLPQAVRIDVDTNGGDLWPTQVVVLRLDSEVTP
ncbi:prepilin-type N-terminal cleavage/methylation domain-containing protein [Pseudomonas lactis]|uniref:Prepilin-type N-terminal cleavage/methylation domain-containing protein n=1 Tax=Pseudomonas lactis TaxID=1615674 RepID=A0A7Y1PWR3_9PSED|nr:prepilin-type N-terminal cleavage/methylation domain-containing protein [Pseudomonas lactis]NNA42862.1 prepilin-type N-terminal cleavage/methylation domain-containing protein [Pseudomonas lactis]